MIFDVVSQIARLVQFSLAQTIAQPREPVASVSDVPIISTNIRKRFNAVKRTAGPQHRYLALCSMVFVAGATRFCPNGLGHKFRRVCHEILDRVGLGGHGMDVLGLPAVQQHQDVIYLSL